MDLEQTARSPACHCPRIDRARHARGLLVVAAKSRFIRSAEHSHFGHRPDHRRPERTGVLCGLQRQRQRERNLERERLEVCAQGERRNAQGGRFAAVQTRLQFSRPAERQLARHWKRPGLHWCIRYWQRTNDSQRLTIGRLGLWDVSGDRFARGQRRPAEPVPQRPQMPIATDRLAGRL